MTNDELLKAYMDQLAAEQQSYRNDMRALQVRMDAREIRTDERMEALQARTDERMEALQVRSDERMEAVKRDIRATIWSALAVAAAVAGIIVSILLR